MTGYTHCSKLELARISQLLGLGIGSLGFGGPFEALKSKGFVGPSCCKVGVKPDSFIKGFDGLIVIALDTESYAFVVPG